MRALPIHCIVEGLVDEAEVRNLFSGKRPVNSVLDVR